MIILFIMLKLNEMKRNYTDQIESDPNLKLLLICILRTNFQLLI